MPRQRKTTRTIHCDAPLVRSVEIDRAAINEEARTVELSFSSEEPVDRWFGEEVLDHKPASVRLDRLRQSGPLLFNHNRNEHLGVVESVKLDGKRGQSVVRFGSGALAEEKFKDVQEGILTSVSFAYRVHKLVLEQESDDGPNVYRATDWEPLEISLVTVPADVTVGVGRSAEAAFDIEIEERTMEDDNLPTPAPAKPAAPLVDVNAERNAAVAEERKRIADITSLGQRFAKFGGEELARQFVENGKSVSEYRDAVMEKMPTEDEAATGGEAPASDLDLNSRETEQYSLVRAIAAAVSNDWSKAGFEAECSREIEERVGRDARGFFVPMEVQKRTMNVTSGASVIATDHLADEFIDTLRPNSVAMTLGATVLDGLQGNISIPKKTGNAGFTWLADDADAVDDDPVLGSISMSPKTVAGSVPMSRRLLKQSSPSIEMLVQNDLRRGAGLAIDLGALEGTGAANQPTGIVNATGVNTQAIVAAGAPTWAELVGFETAVADDNALDGSLAYVTTSGVRGNLKVTAKDAGSGRFLMEGAEANGYRLGVRNGITANRIIFGNWTDLLIGMWGILDVMPDMAAKAAAGGLVIRVFQDVDIAVRHAESFCINA